MCAARKVPPEKRLEYEREQNVTIFTIDGYDESVMLPFQAARPHIPVPRNQTSMD